MSTEIKTIKGSYHSKNNVDFTVDKDEANVSLTRFWNGEKDGVNIQLTISQRGHKGQVSYIHLNKDKCEELAKILNECFDYDKYPSE